MNNNSEIGESKLVNDLFASAEKANYPNLKKNLDNCFSAIVMDHALRRCIKNSTRERKEFHDSIKLILDQIVDINFINPSFENSTILHCVCNHKDPTIVDIILSNGLSREKNRIDINCKDSKGNNALHYLLREPPINENEVEEIMKKLFNEGIEINEENSLGFTPLACTLLSGSSKLSSILINEGAKKNHIIKSTGDNLLHCAVNGKNLSCVYLVLELDKRYKNLKGLTPIDIAAQKDGAVKILQLLQTCGDSTEVDTKMISLIKPLEEFKNKNFASSLELLNKIKRSKNEVNQNLDWNIFLNRYYITLSENEKNELTNKLSKTSFNFKTFVEFFSEIDKFPETFKIDNYILIFNKGLTFFKVSDYTKTFSTLYDYLIKSGINCEWMMYINSAFIFTEICINLKQIKTADIVLQKIDEFLTTTFINNKSKRNEVLKDVLCDYLNSREIINKFTPGEELFCVLNLFKAYRSLAENKFEEVRKHFDEYKRLILYCKYKEALPIFNRLRSFYKFLKIKLVYQQNIQTKCNKYLKALHIDMLLNPNINSQVFYLNSLSIINLKQKKYSIAEYYLKNCIQILKQQLRSLDFKTRPHFLYFAKYNLGLCYFFQKQYEKAYTEFKSILNKLNYYPYIWYRVGLCCVEIELINIKKQKNFMPPNDLINSVSGYKFSGCGETINNDFSNTTSQSPTSGEAPFTHKKIILKSIGVNEKFKNYNNKINEAINAFKQTLVLFKENIYYKKELKDIYNYYTASTTTTSSNNESDNSSRVPSHQLEGFSCPQISVSANLNLIFCLVIREEWMEALFYIKELEGSEAYSKDLHFILDNYKIECLINLNKLNVALELIKNNLLSNNNNLYYSNSESKGNFYSKFNPGYSEVSYKLAFYINLTKLHLLNNSWIDVEKTILLIFSLLNISSTNGNFINTNDLPPFVLNILVYYYIRKENTNVAIQILKNRRIPFNFIQHTQYVQSTQRKIS